MNIKNKLSMFIIAFAIVLSLIPTLNVQAATTDFKIISDSEVTVNQAKNWAKSKGATDTFISLADLYFKYSSKCGNVNPAIAYVQAAKETGYGKFGGVLDDSFHNPCGLKKSTGGGDTDKNAHQTFGSWDEGVQAHMDHLALYAGADGYPKSNTYDPRHFVKLKGTATTVITLGAKWAPSSTYGEEVSKSYQNLLDFAGVSYQKDEDNGSSVIELGPKQIQSKPNPPNVADVIPLASPQTVNIADDGKPNITSTIGWKSENGNWYYYKSDNTKAIGWIKPESSWYYLKDDGKMATDWISDQGKSYYFDKSGVMVKGWKEIDKKWYFFTNSGVMATGIQYDGSGLYYFNNSGVLASYDGWQNLNNKWYYFEKSGKIKTGWLQDNNNWYYFQGDGSMVTGIKKVDGKIYMFSDTGAIGAGWAQIDKNWYYFINDGTMATGWIMDNGSYYYLYDTGAMATGWINVEGMWYYLNSNGTMATGWVTSGGDSYYLDPATGRMVTNTTIDGSKIGANGKKQTSSGNNYTSTKPSNGKKTITIDPGHDYGSDYGAENKIDGVTYSETDLDMQVAVKLKSELEKRGYNVIMTRNDGEKPSYGSLYESLAHRVNIANDTNSDFFMCIHHNSAGPTAKGVEAFYSVNAKDENYGGGLDSNRLERSKKLAQLINDSVASRVGTTNRGSKPDTSSGVGSLFVLRNTKMPAVLLETGFITNAEEAERCASSEGQQKVAEAIADVIAQNI